MKKSLPSLITFSIALFVFSFYEIYAFHHFSADMNQLIISALALGAAIMLFVLDLAYTQSKKDKTISKAMAKGAVGILLLLASLLALPQAHGMFEKFNLRWMKGQFSIHSSIAEKATFIGIPAVFAFIGLILLITAFYPAFKKVTPPLAASSSNHNNKRNKSSTNSMESSNNLKSEPTSNQDLNSDLEEKTHSDGNNINTNYNNDHSSLQ